MKRHSLAATLKIRGGCDRDVYGKKAGKGALVQWEKSATLGVSQDQTLIIWTEEEPSATSKLTAQSGGYSVCNRRRPRKQTYGYDEPDGDK